jgi:hypothetical protein
MSLPWLTHWCSIDGLYTLSKSKPGAESQSWSCSLTSSSRKQLEEISAPLGVSNNKRKANIMPGQWWDLSIMRQVAPPQKLVQRKFWLLLSVVLWEQNNVSMRLSTQTLMSVDMLSTNVWQTHLTVPDLYRAIFPFLELGLQCFQYTIRQV